MIDLTYKRLEPIVNSIDKTVICQTLTDNGNGTYTFGCRDTAWATPNYDVTIGVVTYAIIDVVCNVSITVSGATLPTVKTFDLNVPIYKHGTILSVAAELNKTRNYKEKFPLIFLHEILDEKKHFDELDAVDTDSDVRMYFLTECNVRDWTVLDGDTKGVKPMRNLYNRFVQALSTSQYVARLTGIGTVKNYNRFGNTTENGVIKNIFNEFLSGVQLKMTIPFLKECECCDASNLDMRPAPAYVYDDTGLLLAVLYSNQVFITGSQCEDVTITDTGTGNVIANVASGGNYNVTVLTHIRDTITSNTGTIIDPIN